ncbi:MAG: hypothetical protein J7L08_02540 [Candidatus Aenigmarchaeota archaeon]|nr:hypothetical protein [Candidatus Aenigmarchaeota archaeon]
MSENIWRNMAIGFFVIIILMAGLIFVIESDNAKMCDSFCEKLGGYMVKYRPGECLCNDTNPFLDSKILPIQPVQP